MFGVLDTAQALCDGCPLPRNNRQTDPKCTKVDRLGNAKVIEGVSGQFDRDPNRNGLTKKAPCGFNFVYSRTKASLGTDILEQ
jgi:hypothetical protein